MTVGIALAGHMRVIGSSEINQEKETMRESVDVLQFSVRRGGELTDESIEIA